MIEHDEQVAGDEQTAGDEQATSDEPAVDAVIDGLREAHGSMRGEADRIATLATGEEQVAAAEKFAEDASRLDEQVGAAARAHDDGD